MNCKKIVQLAFLVLMPFVMTNLVSCGGNDMQPEKALNSFSKLMKEGNFDDLSLTIYYINPFTLTLRPVSEDDLINMSDVNKIVVNGSTLKKHINLLNQISSDLFIPIDQEPLLDARMYYVFEMEKSNKVFDIAMWGKGNSIFINGVEASGNDIFYDVVIPFLPKDAARDLKAYLNHGD